MAKRKALKLTFQEEAELESEQVTGIVTITDENKVVDAFLIVVVWMHFLSRKSFH